MLEIRQWLTSLRRTALWIAAAVQLASLAACGGGGYGGGGMSMPVMGVGASKLFVADSTDMAVGSLVNRDPAAGSLMVDRLIGPQPGAFPYNYANFSNNIGSLALDTTHDRLYVGNGTSVLVFEGASTASGDFLPAPRSFSGSIGNTGSLFLDVTGDRLYVGDDTLGVKVYTASTASGMPSPTRTITGDFGTTFQIHGVAVDTTPARDILYVSNTNHTTSSDQIRVFDGASAVSGSNPPSRTITPAIATVPQHVGGIFVDAANNILYVAGGSAGMQVMVFSSASTANDVSGATTPSKVLSGFPSGILSVAVDATNDRLYAVGSNGHVYLVEAISMQTSGMVTAKDASLSNGGMLTAVAVDPN